MKVLEHKNQLFVGDKVQFTYNDKPRQGRIEKLDPVYFTLQIAESNYKNFNWDKVQSDIVIL